LVLANVIPCLDVTTAGSLCGRSSAAEADNCATSAIRSTGLRYNEQGADEMVFFDIRPHGRATMVEVIQRAADQCFMPLTVGGGAFGRRYPPCCGQAPTKSASTLCLNPDLIRTGSENLDQYIVVSMDAKKVGPDKWAVFAHGRGDRVGRDRMGKSRVAGRW
jgi:cyclase